MIFEPTAIRDVVLISVVEQVDDRGLFARTFCTEEFTAQGLETRLAQCSLSYNHRAGTLRGLHRQLEPHAEVKLVRCSRGAIFDVAVDLRPGSPTYLKHVSAELTSANRRALYVPRGFAHGFQTLADDVEVIYQTSTAYAPGFERGYRYDDPAFGIAWPLSVSLISAKDACWPLLHAGSGGGPGRC